MSSRNTILQRIQKFQSDETLVLKKFESSQTNLLEDFITNANLAGATVYETKVSQQNVIKTLLEQNDYFIFDSSLGVAENGALWCEATEQNREKLFVSNDLVIRIKKENIVSNMHIAYKTISLEKIAFGTFIAGPSKTADIEQSLVLGAHGAMKLYIFLEE